MRFNPVTKAEAEASGLLEKGVYDAEVTEAEDTVTKQDGHPMMALTLKVFPTDDSAPRVVFDYLLTHAMRFKLYHFAEATGIQGKAEAGGLEAADCVGKLVKVMLDREEARPKQGGGMYRAKNVVRDYVTNGTPPTQPDDDLPF